MKNPKKSKNISDFALTFFVIFLVNSFVITVSFMLFFNYMELDTEHIRLAAIFTFGNVILISLLFVGVYGIINYFTVKRPLQTIKKGLESITKGDFSVHLDENSSNSSFNEIAESINIMSGELSSVETLKTDFISNVSHEIKTPLAVIKNYAQLLKTEKITDSERIEYAKAIIDSSNRLNELIINILRLNKLDNQKLQPQKQEYNLAAQLADCLLQFENVWEEKEIELNTNIPDEEMICSDKELMNLVWNNLLSNAFKFTDIGGKVSVTMMSDEENVSIDISDSGCGMTAETGKHIFDKFYQGDTSRSTQGNGLGLALVKRVIDMINGEISVQSTLGEGSTFTVKIRRNTNEKI